MTGVPRKGSKFPRQRVHTYLKNYCAKRTNFKL